MSVGLVIVSHSAQLAKGVVELAGQMVQGKVKLADAGGAEDDTLGTSVEKISAAIQSVDNPVGVLVLLDLGSALLSAETALELLDEEQRGRVEFSYAPLVEGAFAAALEASLGRNLTQVKQAAEKAARGEELRKLKPVANAEEQPVQPAEEAAPPVQNQETRTIQLTITNPSGLHARPAVLFVQTAARFAANIQVFIRGKQANATLIAEVLRLGVRPNETITVRASGQDAEAALQALSELVQASFHETPAEQQADSAAMPIAPQITQEQLNEAAYVWKGLVTSSGFALGPALLYAPGFVTLDKLTKKHITEQEVAGEQEKVRGAIAKAVQDLVALALDVRKRVGRDEAGIFEAQALMLQDPTLLQPALDMIKEQQIAASSALAAVGEQQARALEQVDNPLIAQRASDVRDAISRAVTSITGQTSIAPDLRKLQHPVILVANDLTPSDTAQLKPGIISGICTVQGGSTAHAAILARALGIPALAGLPASILERIHNDEELALDAKQGLLYQQPSAELRQQFTQCIEQWRQERLTWSRSGQRDRAPISLNKRNIYILANIGSEAEAEAAREWGAAGVGLLRTEFLFAGASTLPDVETQYQRYKKIFQAFKGPDTNRKAGPIVARTLDAGADKPLPALEKAIELPKEANPALGLRGLRIHLAHPELLEQQLRALLMAAAATSSELHIMVPMLSTIEELQQLKQIFSRVHTQLQNDYKNIPERVPLGIMVEVPAAAIMARELAKESDFFSIGANDLLQYTLACDRTNTQVASLYNPMQPAHLRLIKMIADAGQQAHLPVAVCGEIAGDPLLAPALVGLGVTELSMTPPAIPKVRAALTSRPAEAIQQLGEDILTKQTAAEIAQLCAQFAGK